MTNPNDVAQIKHLDSLASHVNVLGSASSTVDGGLWFEVVDGLPVVKMNCGGSTFALDAKPADGALIGDKLYLGGHIFKLTGFASGLTFSDNNFYAAGNLVGSVSNFAFQFTDAAALSVAEGGTISITQLDTDVVDFSLDLGLLNANPLPAPNIVFVYYNEELDFSSQTLTVENYAVSATITAYGPILGFVTDSTGNLNFTNIPDGDAVTIIKCTTASKMVDAMGGNGSLPAAATVIQNPTYWVFYPNMTNILSSNNGYYTCQGQYTCVFNATDANASATVTLNMTVTW